MKQRAKQFAIRAHAGQKRKTSNLPYVTHPIRVAKRLEQAGFSDELVCAGYLHDVAEDTSYQLVDIKKLFGQRVAQLVAAHTEDKSKSWTERKQHTIDTVRDGDKEVKYLIVADKLDNLLDLKQAYREYGNMIWNSFNAGMKQQKWYNKSIAKNMYNGLTEEDIPDYFREYEQLIDEFFG